MDEHAYEAGKAAARELSKAAWGSDEHAAWKTALCAVCNHLGQRIDEARFGGQEKAS